MLNQLHCLLLDMPGVQCFRGMLLFFWQVTLHISYLDLISRYKDILRKLHPQIIFIRGLLESYCFVLLTNRAPPKISDDRPDMR